MTIDERLYEIACRFPALKRKGVDASGIPGITPTGFYDKQLADYLYGGCGLSEGEFLILEFLLNIFDPYEHTKFNFGHALHKWDPRHMEAFFKGTLQIYNGR